MARFRFAPFTLDEADRRLTRNGASVDINARYFDALLLLVRESGSLITKDRFFAEIWRGVPVTDEALTQCVRTLRRQLGDEAGRPRFIETVPKYGYRFIAPVELDTQTPAPKRHDRLLLVSAGTLGAGAAGVIGGLLYGFAASTAPGAGAASALLVILCVTVLMALIGGMGVTAGIVLAGYPGRRWWQALLGGAAGGLVVGVAGLAGAMAGLAVPFTGGRLMAGSLALLAMHFPASRLKLDGVGRVFGEARFGPASQVVTAGLEGALFATYIAAGLALAARKTALRAPE